MGALTSNRKRGDDYYKSPNLYSSDLDRCFDSQISKKPKLSSSMHLSPEQPISSRSAVSRIHHYPEPKNRIRREVHAPCRVPRFGFTGCSSRELRPSASVVRQKKALAGVMGNVLGFHYEKAKSAAFGALRYLKKDKEVIDVEAETVKDDVSEDGHEGRSVVLDLRSRETNGAVAKLRELDGKSAERNFQPSSSSMISDLTNGNVNVDSAGKMLDSLSVNRDAIGGSIHKKLLEGAERRNPKLSNLSFQIQLNQNRLATFQLLRPAKKQEEDVLHEPFLPLTKEEEAEVFHAFSNSNRSKVLVTHVNSNIEITGEVLQCLKPGEWLNDEVINVFLELLKEREKREPKKFLKCHFFNTFFYKKLIGGRSGYDFKSVRRWTSHRKLGYCLLECDKIFVPIHKEIHWCLAVINKKDEKFQYLDSLKGVDSQVLKVLARYYVDEVKDKSGEDIDVSSWKQEYVKDLPGQQNGFDCGMFMIKYTDFYSRGLGLCLTQKDMPYFRLRTAKEILRLKAE
uniref:Putative ubiquitin-like-specific protease ESD4 isoform X1 n=1 Tax=Davidia involucrata TaxID=16924 RepID=A0A5B7A0F3_DAVIN